LLILSSAGLWAQTVSRPELIATPPHPPRIPAACQHGLGARQVAKRPTAGPLFAEASIILVASDGIESRRAANHLARRADKPVVFACVLMDGAYGEVLRIPTPAVGCLLCARDELIRSGAMINPETHLDRDYGTGTRHRPMTAVGGDLTLVGNIAAKAAVTTLLQRRAAIGCRRSIWRPRHRARDPRA
jgi:hypothetical protein